jgi:hypothetical protein
MFEVEAGIAARCQRQLADFSQLRYGDGLGAFVIRSC